MKRIKVYESFAGNIFITNKEMPKHYELIEQFDNVPDAEKWVYHKYDYSGLLDRSLSKESCYDLSDDFNEYTFNYFDYV